MSLSGFAAGFAAGWKMVDDFMGDLEERREKEAEKAEAARKAGEEPAMRTTAEQLAGQRLQDYANSPDAALPEMSEADRAAIDNEGIGDRPAPARRASTDVDPRIRDGIASTAEALGIDPVDLATVISYETGGTFNPTQAGPTTQWGRHRGLIQFGEPQARANGVNWDDPIGSQLGPNGAVARYLRNAGVKPGMGLLDIYSAVNAGAPGLYNRSDANNGGAPGTVRDKVEQQMEGHRAKARALFGNAGQRQQGTAAQNAPGYWPAVPAQAVPGPRAALDVPEDSFEVMQPTFFANAGGAIPDDQGRTTFSSQAPNAQGSVFLRHETQRPQQQARRVQVQPQQAQPQQPQQAIPTGPTTADRFREMRAGHAERFAQQQADRRAQAEAQRAYEMRMRESELELERLRQANLAAQQGWRQPHHEMSGSDSNSWDSSIPGTAGGDYSGYSTMGYSSSGTYGDGWP